MNSRKIRIFEISWYKWRHNKSVQVTLKTVQINFHHHRISDSGIKDPLKGSTLTGLIIVSYLRNVWRNRRHSQTLVERDEIVGKKKIENCDTIVFTSRILKQTKITKFTDFRHRQRNLIWFIWSNIIKSKASKNISWWTRYCKIYK